MGKIKINVMDTSFRDGFQSVFGARVATDDFLPAIEAAKNAGIKHFETGGGARFQALYFYCNEDAFAMMDKVRKTVGPDIDLQTLSRGINVVGLDSQSSDLIKLHAVLFKKHGVTTIRNFDALNDVNNLIYSGKCITEAGLKHEVAITMMELPHAVTTAHTPAFYLETLKKILDAGIKFDSLCFKDASGTSVPSKVYETIKGARKMLPDTRIRFHTHETAGISVVAYKAALEGGADGLDLAMSPVSGGTCSPDIVTMWHALRGTDFDLGVDIKKILEAEEVFKECMKDYFMPPESREVDPRIVFSPMPGGALTANTQMMRDGGMLDKYPAVIDAMEEVVKKGGFGTSVTPVSQFYFQQAYNNVVFGPWKKIADGYGKMVLGYFGRTPVPADPEIIKISAEQLKLEPTVKSPIEINDADPKKSAASARQALTEAGITDISDENIFITACCGAKGIAFLKGEAKNLIRKKEKKAARAEGKGSYSVKLSGHDFHVEIKDNKAMVNGREFDVSIAESGKTAAPAAAGPNAAASAIKSPFQGVVMKINVTLGQQVKRGDTAFIVEALKMETEIKAPADGLISAVLARIGDTVQTGQELARVS